MPPSFIEKREEELRKESKKDISFTKYPLVWPALRREPVHFFFPVAIHGGQGQGVSLRTEQRHFSLIFRQRHRVPPPPTAAGNDTHL